MTQSTNLTKSYLFKKYAYHRFCDEYRVDGSSKSLDVLYDMAEKPSQNGQGFSREEQIDQLLPAIAQPIGKKILLVEEAMTNIYKIDADCEDSLLLGSTIVKLREILPLFKTSDISELKVRTAIHNQIYDLYEQLYPDSKQFRFEELKRMVRDIKVNDGSFDHNPLNMTAQRLDYFMKKIPAKQRFALLSEIQNKTSDKNKYDYGLMLDRFANEYYEEKKKQQWVEKIKTREQKQNRYEQIRQEELPKAQDNQTKIALYHELLGLVNCQDFGRIRKFNEKKTIYNHLIDLYTQEGMEAEAQHMEILKYKFLEARKIASEAARLKGYQKQPQKNIPNTTVQNPFVNRVRS